MVNQEESVSFLFLGLSSSFLRFTILPFVFLMVVGTISKLGLACTCLLSSRTLLRKALRLFTISYWSLKGSLLKALFPLAYSPSIVLILAMYSLPL